MVAMVQEHVQDSEVKEAVVDLDLDHGHVQAMEVAEPMPEPNEQEDVHILEEQGQNYFERDHDAEKVQKEQVAQEELDMAHSVWAQVQKQEEEECGGVEDYRVFVRHVRFVVRSIGACE